MPRLCWRDCQACWEAETLLEAAMHCEKPAVERAATDMATLLSGSTDALPPGSLLGPRRDEGEAGIPGWKKPW